MGRGVTKHSSMRDWLKSPPPGKGGGAGQFLKGWKKKPGYIDAWIHAKTLPMTVWQHPVPTLTVIDDKDTKEKITRVFPKRYTCHETEEVLDALYWRETKGDPTSARKHPPKRCGQCKFVEWVWQQCWLFLDTHDWSEDDKAWKEKKKGKGKGIDPCSLMFKFVGEGEKDNYVIHAGGLCGLFGSKKLPEDLIKRDPKTDKPIGGAMVHAKISPRDAWSENWTVKAQSVMCVVDNDNPAAGVQISTETKELGEKVKDEIVRVIKSQDIDIQKTPYCIRWEYDEKAQMGKMYTATAMMKIKPTERILKMIRGQAPDLSSLETPFNQDTMRTYLERHCKIKDVPWDEFFPTKEQQKEWAEEDEASAGEDDEVDVDDENEDTEDGDDADDDDSDDGDDDEDEDDDDLVACDDCEKPMKADASECPHCGKKYEVEKEAAPEPEPPKKLKTRSEMAAEKAAKAKGDKGDKKKSKAEESKGREPGDDTEEDSNQDDEIPF